VRAKRADAIVVAVHAFLNAGASAVQVDSAIFRDPSILAALAAGMTDGRAQSAQYGERRLTA